MWSGIRALAMAASALVRGSVRAPFPLSVCTLIGNGSPCPSGEQCQSEKGWSRSPMQARECAGKTAKAPGCFQYAVSLLCVCVWWWGKQVCACTLQERSLGFLQPSSKPHLFSNQLRGSSSQCWTPGLGCLNVA